MPTYVDNLGLNFGNGGVSSDYGGGQEYGLGELMKILGGGGFFGLGDIATGGLITGASALLGGLGGLLAGKSDAQKNAGKVFNLAQNRLGQSVLNPDQYLADYQRASRERNQAVGERINKQFGLDSGVAQSEMAYRMESPLAQFMLQSKQQADALKSQNDNMLLSLMGQLSQYT